MIAAAAIVALGVSIAIMAAAFTRLFHDMIAGFLKVVGTAIYMLSYVFFLIIDFLELTFKRILGLKGTYEITVDTKNVSSSDDLVLTLINSKTVQNIFWALSIIALFLLVVSVIIAIIRTEYQWDKQGNSKGPIFGKALKAIALYLTVPVACIFGVWGASQLLKALDQATSGGSESYISSMAFSAAATSGNRLQSEDLRNMLRQEYSDAGGNLSQTAYAARFFRFTSDSVAQQALSSNNDNSNDAFDTAQKSIDEAFRSTYGITIENIEDEGSGAGFTYNAKSASDAYDFSADNEDHAVLWLIRNSVPESGSRLYVCSPYNLTMVYFYYGLLPGAGGVGWGYNHILSIIVAFLILKVLFDITCGVLKRAYELVVLYIISPPVVALMPLDDGAAYKSWVKAFIGKTLMAYGGVLAINFFFMLVPIFSTIKIFTTAGGLSGPQELFFGGGAIADFFDMLVQLLFVIAGAFSISSLSKMISGIIGAEDAAENGSAISGAVGGMMGKVGGLALGAAGGLAKGAIKAMDKPGNKKKALKTKEKEEEEAAKAKQRQNEISALQNTKNADGSDKSKEQIAQDKALAESMKQTDALKSMQSNGGSSGGSGGGDKKKDDGMGDGKIANFVRNHVTGGRMGKVLGAAKGLGSLYGGAINNATGGELKKGYESTVEKGQAIGSAVGYGLTAGAMHVGVGAYKDAKLVGKGAKKVGRGVATAAKATGSGIAKAASWVGGTVAAGATAAGHGISKGASWLGKGTANVAKAIGKGVVYAGKGIGTAAEFMSRPVRNAYTAFRNSKFGAATAFYGKQAVGAVAKGAKVVGKVVVDGATMAGNAVVKGAKATGRVVAKGATATGHVIAEGARATGQVIAKGAKATGHVIASGAKATGHVIAKGVTATGKVVAPAAKATGQVIAKGAKATGHVIAEGATATGRVIAKGAKATGHVIAEGAQFVGDITVKGAQGIAKGTRAAFRKPGQTSEGQEKRQMNDSEVAKNAAERKAQKNKWLK